MIDRRLSIGICCYPTFGGSGIVATEIGLVLAKRGHRVHFISYDVPGRLDRFVDNVLFHEVETVEYPLFHQSPYPLALASKIVEVCRWEKLDLLHVHYAVPHATSAYLAKQILGSAAPKIVTTLHGTDITLVGSDPSFLPITRFSIVESDGITTPSAYLRAATYEKLDIPPSTAIEVIPNFVDVERFSPADPSAIQDRCPSLQGAKRKLVHVSNFRPLKRVHDVLRVFARVRKKMPAQLYLVGDGPERSRAELEARELGIASDVCFLGKQLSFVEVLRASDIFLMPSESESFGLAALEAMACGVPVVGSNVGGVPEVVQDGETGFLCPVGDVDAMADRAFSLLEDRDLFARLSKGARARAEEVFPRDPVVSRYEAYYRRVLGEA
jgi:N-acetyl-alpha-D-glucosaminyl L-malate synthase BshA